MRTSVSGQRVRVYLNPEETAILRSRPVTSPLPSLIADQLIGTGAIHNRINLGWGSESAGLFTF